MNESVGLFGVEDDILLAATAVTLTTEGAAAATAATDSARPSSAEPNTSTPSSNVRVSTHEMWDVKGDCIV